MVRPERVRGAIDVWRLELDPARRVGAAAELLDEAEVRQSQRLRFEADRVRFVARRAFTRRVLALYTGIAPASLRLRRVCRRCGGPGHGKPHLPPGVADGIDLSVSSSQDIVVVAVGDGLDVGIDVEAVERCAGTSLVASVCTERERRLLTREADELARRLLFCRLWTRKEAAVKLVGLGLAQELASVDCSTDAVAGIGPTVGIRLRDLSLGAAYRGALATWSLPVVVRDVPVEGRWLVAGPRP